jgi:lysophospholipase L1-like esterase
VIRAHSVRSLGWIAATGLLCGATACTSSARSDGGALPSALTTAATSAASTTNATTTTTSLSEPPQPSTAPSTTTGEPGLGGQACDESKVYVIGDSLTKGADFPGGLEQLLAGAGYTARVDAEVSRFIKAGVQILDFQAHRRHDKLEPVVMVALGTNDAHAGFTTTALALLVDQLMTAVGPHRLVIWVTTQFLPDYRSDAFNQVLRLEAARHTNLLIADWAATDRSQYLAGDGVHYSNEGYRVRALFMLEQLRAVTRCATEARRT